MRLVFILGNHPAISTAEILRVTGITEEQIITASPQILMVEGYSGMSPKELQSKLGGTIKIGTVIAEVESDPDIVQAIVTYSLAHAKVDTRWTFGVSAYAAGGGTVTSPHAHGMKAKERLTNENNNFRARVVVPSEGNALTSATVLKNKIIEEGAEFLILRKGKTVFVAVTDTIQPLEEFSWHDYGRPGRDTLQGMLPPKLARMMVNIAGIPKHKSILDPFCGSGTVLTEALQLGYRTMYGSDRNPEAIKASTENMNWMIERLGNSSATASITDSKDAPKFAFHVTDARAVNRNHPNQTIGGIVTEPFLGAPLRGSEKRGQLQQELFLLGHLYYEALSIWQQVLETNGVVVMIIPVYKIRVGSGHRAPVETHTMDTEKFLALGYERVQPLSPSLIGRLGATPGRNKGLLYGRADQHVWREIIVLRRK